MPARIREAMHAAEWHRAWLAAVCLVLALSSGAMAQDYPSRTIKLIVPTGAGGITDILARLIGKSISEQGLEPAGNSPEEFAKVMQPTSKNGFASHVKPASSRNNRGGGAVRIPDTIFKQPKII